MIQVLEWRNLSKADQTTALARAPSTNAETLRASVKDIVAAVKRDGDAAVAGFSAKFDGYNKPYAFVSDDELTKAVETLPPDLKTAIMVAIKNVTAFHEAQRPTTARVATSQGVLCEMQWRAIEKVGLYVPGGLAPLFSSVIMLAVPAKIAGCTEIVLCSPPSKDGFINQGTLAAAKLCGITKVLPVGGAQAIAAMAYGTETTPKVDKIFGPGNAFVTQAKQLVAQDPDGAAIDMPAGPSEVMVIADGAANPAWVAADLLAQAEHGRDSQAICVTTDASLAEKIAQEVDRQTALLGRENLIRESLNYSRVIVVKDIDEALAVANLYAPEHLILQVEQAENLVPKIQTAGAVFVGAYAPETAGDYASGGNHVLPTYGYARAYSGLNLQSFMRSMSVQSLTREGLAALGPSLVAMAQAEGLDAHAAAVLIRGVC